VNLLQDASAAGFGVNVGLQTACQHRHCLLSETASFPAGLRLEQTVNVVRNVAHLNQRHI